MKYESDLLNICEKSILPETADVVIHEPYIPYIPEDWNRIIVLAESQNLSKDYHKYVSELKALTQIDRMRRLGQSTGDIGVYPWDDGSLKIALQASLNLSAESTAVSNGVLWSQRGNKSQNINPDLNLQALSSQIWAQFLTVLAPEMVICSGKVAANVIRNSGWLGKTIKLRSPSRTAMSRVSGMFDENDLLKRFPEVGSVLTKHPEWLGEKYRLNKIFFACHAVSLTRNITSALT